MESLSVWLPKPLADRLRAHSKTKNKSVSATIRELVECELGRTKGTYVIFMEKELRRKLESRERAIVAIYAMAEAAVSELDHERKKKVIGEIADRMAAG